VNRYEDTGYLYRGFNPGQGFAFEGIWIHTFFLSIIPIERS